MSKKGLVLNLAPGERVLINGVLIENGDRRAHLLVATPQARILRLRDAILPDQATTPVRRACLAAQRFVSGETRSDEGPDQLLMVLRELTSLFREGEGSVLLEGAIADVASGRFYHAWRALRRLLPLEEALSGSRVPEPDGSEDGSRPVAAPRKIEKLKVARRLPSSLGGRDRHEQGRLIALRKDTGAF